VVQHEKEKRIKIRLRSTFYFVFWIFILLLVRLFQVQVVQAGKFQHLAAEEHDEKIFIPAVRGSIFDRNGNLLAMSISGYSIAANPLKISHPKKTARDLSTILNLPESDLEKLLTTQSSFVWILRKVSFEKAEKVKALGLDGIDVVEEPTGKRIYPKGDLACHVLGFTGIDEQGLDGIELYYNKQLQGTPGYFLASIDGLGRVMPNGVSRLVPAIRGADITLTLDDTLQYIAQQELEACVKAKHAKSGDVIIMNPYTGAILAMASYPYFNGNEYWNFPAFVLRNHAISDDYEPGSTFKLILAAAALDSGKVSIDEKFRAFPFLEVDGWRIHNADDGLTPASPFADIGTIIQDSLNVGAASIALKIGTQVFAKMIERFGLDKPTGIDLPGETSSIVPDPKTWSRIQLATISYGQGIAVTPLQMLAAYAAIANGGYPVRPHLVEKVTFSDGQTVVEPEGHAPTPIMSAKTDEELKYLLSLVVQKGTAPTAAIPNYTTAGKTGTAHVNENGRYLSGRYVASFIGFAPVEKPAFVMLVNVNEPRFPYWGGTVAAPLFKKIGEEVLWRLEVPPSKGMVHVGPFEVWSEESSPKKGL
jgi:stage V sporulation protein D (sporulation-specific penicillin-binding protein)